MCLLSVPSTKWIDDFNSYYALIFESIFDVNNASLETENLKAKWWVTQILAFCKNIRLFVIQYQ